MNPFLNLSNSDLPKKRFIRKEIQTPIEEALKVDEDGMTTAKALYEFLELHSNNYSRWCKSSFESNPFAVENVDYFPFLINEECGGQATRDYKITSDLAKKLAMASNSDKGEVARDYFIQVEQNAKALVNAVSRPPTHSEALRGWADEIDRRIELESLNAGLIADKQELEVYVEVLEPKAEAFDTYISEDSLFTIGDAANKLGFKKMGQNNLFEYLRNEHILKSDNTPYRDQIESGHFDVRSKHYKDQYGRDRESITSRITISGLEYIRRKLVKDGYVRI